MRLGRRVYTSFQGVQMDKPSEKERPTEKTTIQMMYHKYVSRKNRIKSMIYMMVNVKGTWFEQRILPNNLSLHPCTVVRAMTAIGELKELVRKKYDSANLHPNTRSQSMLLAVRAERVSSG